QITSGLIVIFSLSNQQTVKALHMSVFWLYSVDSSRNARECPLVSYPSLNLYPFPKWMKGWKR
ncbi:MAG TPA: hypothetical protein PKZ26_08220, partial [Anaerolineaceae bacterium]|nr:hypothetical protein [Anaerolineaceae bacterium]